MEPKYGFCPDCGEPVHNRGAHAEACPGRLEFAGYYRCSCCHQEGRRQGHFCPCGGERLKVMQPPPQTSWPKDAA
jgi:hypothetical protein